MPLAVSDTGPLNYLILTVDVGLLPKLFERVLVPVAVFEELRDSDAPAVVRNWTAQTPTWLEVRPNPERFRYSSPPQLDEGERATIALAIEIGGSDLVLMDDREGVSAARREGLAVTGTLGVLDIAARRGMVDLGEALSRLKATSFHYRQGLLDSLLARHTSGGR